MCVKNAKTLKKYKLDLLRRNRFLIINQKEINIYEW